MSRLGDYEIKEFSKDRQNIALLLSISENKHAVHSILEFDVTLARDRIRAYKEKTGVRISFTGWIVKCVAQAVNENKELNVYRHGNNKLIFFEDVDIPIPVERRISDTEVRLMAYIIRKANEKSVLDITKEIREIQKQEIDDKFQILGGDLTRFERAILRAPRFIKKFAIWLKRKDAFFLKDHMGTVGVTAVGMMGNIKGSIVPMGAPTVMLFVIAGIHKKPVIIDDEIVIREILNITLTVDHDIIDGSPMVRFIARVCDLVENGSFLDTL